MKWILLIVIVLVILIIFGLWRRTQGVPGSAGPSMPHSGSELPSASTTRFTPPAAAPPASAPPASAPPAEAPPAAAQAAEAGVDEVAAAPAAETRPVGHAEGTGGRDETWWPDTEGPRDRS